MELGNAIFPQLPTLRRLKLVGVCPHLIISHSTTCHIQQLCPVDKKTLHGHSLPQVINIMIDTQPHICTWNLLFPSPTDLSLHVPYVTDTCNSGLNSFVCNKVLYIASVLAIPIFKNMYIYIYIYIYI